MRVTLLMLLCLLLSGSLQARAQEFVIEAIDEESPVFPLGKATRPNLLIRSVKNPDIAVGLGFRFQGTASYTDPKGVAPGVFDAFARRARFEFSAQFSKYNLFVMDVRNDNAGRGDQGERSFNIGDAYFASKKLLGSSLLNFKAYRAKVDVSRTETAKSSWTVYYDRPAVADEAANFVSHNRRAANVQLYGDYEKKIAYSVAVGDGVQSDAFEDAQGNSAAAVARQNPMFGGKLILSPIPGWEEEERTETYFGFGQHFSVGAGFFRTGNIRFTPSNNAGQQVVDHNLLNLEFSAHYRSLFVQAEYFRFDDVIEDFTAASLNKGKSVGWYALTEIALPRLAFIAPFFRYERWNRFQGKDGYLQITRAGGVNWYLRGNTMKVGFAVQADSFGSQIGTSQTAYKVLSQLHF